MKIIVVGCGRVGAQLANRLFQQGHQVTVVDVVASAFENLDPSFRGRTLEGDVLAQDLLRRAGIEQADGLAAVTSSDTLNAVVAHIARTVYHVPNVVVRNYEPRLQPALRDLRHADRGRQHWGAQRMEEMLGDASLRTVFSAGNGEVEVYEIIVPIVWHGRRLGEIVQSQRLRARRPDPRGKAALPTADTVVEDGDMLHLSATFEGIEALRRQLVAAEGGLRCSSSSLAADAPAPHLAATLVAQGHQVRLIENRRDVLARIHRELPTEVIYEGDPTDPTVLGAGRHPRGAGVGRRHHRDADNLALCYLARVRYNVPRTIARINNPRTAWLFDKKFHVDVAVNQAAILSSLIEEEMSLGDMMTLLKLRRGQYSLVEEKIPEGAKAVGIAIKDLKLPESA